MPTQRALIIKEKGIVEVSDNVPLPKLRDDYILVRTKAVALNPTDWKGAHGHYGDPAIGAIVGCDYSGIVEEIGSKVTTSFKVGDKVAGFVHGADPEKYSGAFAQHIPAKGDLQIKIDIPFEDAATLGVGITTVGQGLYQSLGLPFPPAKVQESTSILIYGASTATGTLAVQFAKLSGLEVIATASPHNFDLLKSLGADQVFDYKDPEVGDKIRKATNDNLRLVFDTISEYDSPKISAAAISSKGGHYSTLLAVDSPRSDVKTTFTLGYTALGEKFSDSFPASQEDFEFGVKFWRAAADLINSGKIKTHPTIVRKGLDNIAQGLQDLKDNKVSGKKLVYTID